MKALRPLLQILNRILAARPERAGVPVQTEFYLPPRRKSTTPYRNSF